MVLHLHDKMQKHFFFHVLIMGEIGSGNVAKWVNLPQGWQVSRH